MSDTPARESLKDWLIYSRLYTRTGIGAVVAGVGLATSVRPSFGVWAVAAVLALAGAAVRFWSAGIISKNERLATTGPYAYVRNPLYFGSLLIALGFFLLNGNPLFVVPATAAGVVIYWRTVRKEEAFLSGRFGADYVAYRRAVPALIPWKGRRRLDLGGETAYALEQSLANREYNGALTAVAMVAVYFVYMTWIPQSEFRAATAILVLAYIALRTVVSTIRLRRHYRGQGVRASEHVQHKF